MMTPIDYMFALTVMIALMAVIAASLGGPGPDA